MPCVPVRLKARKPEVQADEGDTLGAHLRRARKVRGLKQIEVAALRPHLLIGNTMLPSVSMSYGIAKYDASVARVATSHRARPLGRICAASQSDTQPVRLIVASYLQDATLATRLG